MKKIILPVICCLFFLQGHSQDTIEVDYWTPFQGDFQQSSNDSFFGIDTAAGNIWQIGQPNKITFNSAASLNRCLVTDTINPYPVNNQSTFTLKIISHDGGYCCQIDFYYYINSTLGSDGGAIFISHDYGLTWTNIVNDPSVNSFSWCGPSNLPYTINDTVRSLNEPGISGISPVQHGATLNVNPTMYPIDTFFLRFVFASDSIADNLDGWAIQYLWVNPINESIEEFPSDNSLTISPNPTSGLIEIESKIAMAEKLISVYDITGTKVVEQKLIGNKIDLAFLENGFYEIMVDTETNHSVRKIIINH